MELVRTLVLVAIQVGIIWSFHCFSYMKGMDSCQGFNFGHDSMFWQMAPIVVAAATNYPDLFFVSIQF